MSRTGLGSARIASGFFFVLGVVSACSVSLLDPSGRACDAEHGCPGDRRCVDGWCVLPNSVVDYPDGGSGPCRQGGQCLVGIGACARLGALSCAEDGSYSCLGDAGEPQPERCDGIDNDCDGLVDVGVARTLAEGASRLAWVPISTGYLAAYAVDRQAVRGPVLRVLNQGLEPVGEEVPILGGDVGEVAVSGLSMGRVGLTDTAIVAIAEAGRLHAARVSSGGVEARALVPLDAGVVSGPKVAVSRDEQYAMLTWIDGRGVAAATLRAGNLSVFADVRSVSDAGSLMTDVSVAAVRNNNFVIGTGATPGGGTTELRFQEYQETLVPDTSSPIGFSSDGPRALQVVSVLGGDGRSTGDAAAVWIEQGQIKGTVELSTAPKVLLPARPGSQYELHAAPASGGVVMAAFESAPQRAFLYRLNGGMTRELWRPDGGVVALVPSAPPSLALGSSGEGAVGFSVSTPGGSTLRAQLVCAP